MRDFDHYDFPLAYLITFRCYGTWLHGDERLSMNRKQNRYGTPRIQSMPRLRAAEADQLKHPPFRLSGRQRAIVETALREVCNHRKYLLRGINVRTNHVHAVVSAMGLPEPILDAFKAYATRALRGSGLLPRAVKPWARHGSTVYLWKEEAVQKAMAYILLGQDKPFAR
jgi:hypothetical protein